MRKTLKMMVAAIVVVLSIVILTSCATNPYTAERATTARDSRFTAYDNGTVLDTKTNLMWATRDNGKIINWAEAKNYCDNYRGGDYKDWRMPTQDELAGLYDANKTRPAPCYRSFDIHVATELIDITCFAPWASDTRGSDAAQFDFVHGARFWYLQIQTYGTRALPVRSVK